MQHPIFLNNKTTPGLQIYKLPYTPMNIRFGRAEMPHLNAAPEQLITEFTPKSDGLALVGLSQLQPMNQGAVWPSPPLHKLIPGGTFVLLNTTDGLLKLMQLWRLIHTVLKNFNLHSPNRAVVWQMNVLVAPMNVSRATTCAMANRIAETAPMKWIAPSSVCVNPMNSVVTMTDAFRKCGSVMVMVSALVIFNKILSSPNSIVLLNCVETKILVYGL